VAAEAMRPVLLAILVCDDVIRHEGTHKTTLVGIFNRISARTFPCTHSRLSIFMSLTNGHGEGETELRLTSQETGETLVGLKGRIRFPDPLAVVDMNFALNNVRFPKAGPYSIDLYVDGDLIGSRRFEIVAAGPPPEKQL